MAYQREESWRMNVNAPLKALREKQEKFFVILDGIRGTIWSRSIISNSAFMACLSEKRNQNAENKH